MKPWINNSGKYLKPSYFTQQYVELFGFLATLCKIRTFAGYKLNLSFSSPTLEMVVGVSEILIDSAAKTN